MTTDAELQNHLGSVFTIRTWPFKLHTISLQIEVDKEKKDKHVCCKRQLMHFTLDVVQRLLD